MRTPSPTVAGAVQALRRSSAPHLFPVSSADRDRQADTLLLRPDLDPAVSIITGEFNTAETTTQDHE